MGPTAGGARGPCAPRHSLVRALLFAAALLPASRCGAQDGESPPEPPPADGGTRAPPVPLAERVGLAIDRGLAWLRGRQGKDGSYGPCIAGGVYGFGASQGSSACYPTGPTSLALFTMLKCGVAPEDEGVRRGFAWLRDRKEGPETSYEVSMLILALEARTNPWKTEREMRDHSEFRASGGERLRTGVKLPAADAAWMRKLVDDLVRRRERRPGWRYNIWVSYRNAYHSSPNGDVDASSTQLALLALLAAERCGIRQPDALYLQTLEWVLQQQQDNGPAVPRLVPAGPPSSAGASGATPPGPPVDSARGWPYIRDSADLTESRATGAMTGCGLASLLICGRILEARGNETYARKHAARAEKAWWDGIAWLRRNWSVRQNPGRDFYHLYHLYCLERVADLRGASRIGEHRWYDEGAEVLIAAQGANGSWTKDDTHGPADVLNTCFALLFLNRSTPAITGE